MIIKNDKAVTRHLLTPVIVLLLTIGGGYGLWYFLPFINNWKTEGIILCDAEVRRGNYFISHGEVFNTASTQSDKVAFSGKYSSRTGTGEGFQYGFGIDLKDALPGQTFVASVWMKRPNLSVKGFLVILDQTKTLNFSVHQPTTRQDDWELLEQKFTIPFQKEIEDLKVYVMGDGKGEIFFDDLKIITQKNLANDGTPSTFQPEVIELIVKDQALKQLEKKRNDALAIGVLESDDTDWVKGKMRSSKSDEEMPVQLRLKGDWLDHLKGDKWSFRIKVKDPFAWNRLKTFSLHTPEARDFLKEWVLHQWWTSEDVLTPRYDFVELKLNGKSLGVYAYEEHFDKQLPESKQRREGVIIRFSEEGFWANHARTISEFGENPFRKPSDVSDKKLADIKPFKESQIAAIPQLQQQLEVAQNLLYQYQNNLKSPDQIFDLKRMAKYYAIVDAMGAYHGTAWHNERFYYNPVTSQLEPIGFDGFPTHFSPRTFLGEGALNESVMGEGMIKNQLFMNVPFLKEYIPLLFKFSKAENLERFFNKIENELRARESFIKKEFPNYFFNKKEFIQKGEALQTMIRPFNNQSVKVFQHHIRGSKAQLKIGNIHTLPVEIIGYGMQQNEPSVMLDTPLIISSLMKKDYEKYVDLEIDRNVNFVFYKVLGTDFVFHSKTLNWKMPENFAPAQEISRNFFIQKNDKTFLENELFSITGEKVIFKTGKHIVTNDIIIPKDYKVFFPPGVELDFRNKTKFISYSPLVMKGTVKRPIKIFSSDQSANGFTVLQAPGRSKLEHVIFRDLNTLDYKNWTLTGAVTFYESDVDIRNSTFTKNHCEDALNLIRCEFNLNQSTISQTFSDGFDADFCKGYIVDCTFQNTTNDGVDVSGSEITIGGSKMIHCGDKGISVGEESKVTVRFAEIRDCPIGVASKDLSKLIIENILLENCTQGFTAYQKKAEFGGSDIEVQKYEAINVTRLYNIRIGCTLNLEGRMIKGE